MHAHVLCSSSMPALSTACSAAWRLRSLGTVPAIGAASAVEHNARSAQGLASGTAQLPRSLRQPHTMLHDPGSSRRWPSCAACPWRCAQAREARGNGLALMREVTGLHVPHHQLLELHCLIMRTADSLPAHKGSCSLQARSWQSRWFLMCLSALQPPCPALPWHALLTWAAAALAWGRPWGLCSSWTTSGCCLTRVGRSTADPAYASAEKKFPTAVQEDGHTREGRTKQQDKDKSRASLTK